jgi:hypothetical protein
LEDIECHEELLDGPDTHEDLDSGYSDDEVATWEGPVNYVSHHEVKKPMSTVAVSRIASDSSLNNASELETLWKSVREGIQFYLGAKLSEQHNRTKIGNVVNILSLEQFADTGTTRKDVDYITNFSPVVLFTKLSSEVKLNSLPDRFPEGF